MALGHKKDVSVLLPSSLENLESCLQQLVGRSWG